MANCTYNIYPTRFKLVIEQSCTRFSKEIFCEDITWFKWEWWNALFPYSYGITFVQNIYNTDSEENLQANFQLCVSISSIIFPKNCHEISQNSWNYWKFSRVLYSAQSEMLRILQYVERAFPIKHRFDHYKTFNKTNSIAV